jgi:hypothetical protein
MSRHVLKKISPFAIVCLKREMFMRTFLPLIFGTNSVTYISTLIQLNANLFLNGELNNQIDSIFRSTVVTTYLQTW